MNPTEVSGGHESIKIMNNNDSKLKIYFRRTIRVPDSKKEYDLPSDCGRFPIYEVTRSKAPLLSNEKGSLYILMYRG